MTQNKKRLGLAVPLWMYQRLCDLAGMKGSTINALCLDIFWEYFNGPEDTEQEKSAG